MGIMMVGERYSISNFRLIYSHFYMKAKKSLGQNFLTSKRAVWNIVRAGNISAGEVVLEIGPGRGVLTKALLEAGARVIAIEKDRELIEVLKQTFEKEIASEQLKLIEGDVLEIEPKDISLGTEAGVEKYKIIANIPYYITGQFLRKFLSGKYQPQSMVLLLQKEVVTRIIARDKKESILSISVKVYGEPKLIGKVPARDFKPAPNVDSAIIAIQNISKRNFTAATEEENFFEIVRAGFAHKRKKLKRNLESVADPEKVDRAFTTCEISENERAEDISLEKWQCLSKNI